MLSMKNLKLNSKYRIQIAVIYDLLMSSTALVGAIFLKYERVLWDDNMYKMLFLSILGNFASLSFSGLYKGLWRFASTPDLIQIIKASVYAVALNIILINFNPTLSHYSLSLFFINWMLYIFLLSGGRFAYRLVKDNLKFKRELNTLIVGTGPSAETLLREIRKSSTLPYHVKGFIDDDVRVIGRTLHGVPIFGDLKKLAKILKNEEIKMVLIADTNISQVSLKEVFETASKFKAEMKMLPNFAQTISGKMDLTLLRKVRPEDLLMRESVKINLESIVPMVKNSSVLITGAGGSIGSELTLQLARFTPKKIILFELSEFFLYEIEGKLKDFYPELEVVSILGDVRDLAQLENVFCREKPQLVFHAAAFKHVPMVEKNFIPAIHTNIKGTLNIAKVSHKYKSDKVVLISTDKAVNPTNIMGATKRIAEIIFELEQQLSDSTKFIAVRFGNVLGSNGSVIPKFKSQIEKGGPITVTHPEINRFFMSIPEASQLVIQAAGMGNGGEIFILEMGSPVRIVDLAEQMIRLAGLTPYQDIDIQYTGLRPGEKMHEELSTSKEQTIKTEHEKVKMVVPEVYSKDLNFVIQKLVSLTSEISLVEVREYIKSIVPEYDERDQSQIYPVEIATTLN
jgi:FlaA1/EpsC-like NDP-sugar epimerase